MASAAALAMATLGAHPLTPAPSGGTSPAIVPGAVLERPPAGAAARLTRDAPEAAPQGQQPSAIDLGTITRGSGSQPRYAVPDFIALTPDASEAARTIAEVLWSDLDFEREFYMIPREASRSILPAASLDRIPFTLWRELGADAVVSGTVRQTGTDLQVQVRLYNVRSQQSVFGKEYTGTTNNLRLYAHTIADDIHEHQRSLRGVARTKLAFVSDRRRQPLAGTVEARSASEVFVSDYDGANQRAVTISRDLNITPAWSPDGLALAYTSYRRHLPDIVLSFIREGRLQNLTNGAGNNFTPAFSPDGTLIAFASNRLGSNMEIYVMNADGTNPRRLTNHPDSDIAPTWSPTGRQIAFLSDRTGRPQIYMMDLDGTNVRRLTSEQHADRPTWSPAPYAEIAFTAQTGARHDIKVYDLTTGEVRQLTFGEGDNESPAYSPTGRHLAFASTRSGQWQIHTMGRDGQGVRQVTRDGGRYPSWSR